MMWWGEDDIKVFRSFGDFVSTALITIVIATALTIATAPVWVWAFIR